MAEPGPYPLLLQPWLLEKVWGGEQLKCLDLEQGGLLGPVGEAWLLSSQAEHQSRIMNGPLKGKTLDQALDCWGVALTGYGEPFPLLLKLLEARENLSIQVHPSDLQEPGRGKEESWLVLRSEGGAVYRGLQAGKSKEDFFSALKQGSPEPVLQKEFVEAGDVLDIPAGTVHAILSGVLLFEAQQPSDVTYRLYDYGRDRPLHLAEGKRVMMDSAPPPARKIGLKREGAQGARRQVVLNKEAYSLEILQTEDGGSMEALEDRFQVLVNLDFGKPAERVVWEGGELELPPGHALMIPPGTGVLKLEGRGRSYVLARPGGNSVLLDEVGESS